MHVWSCGGFLVVCTSNNNTLRVVIKVCCFDADAGSKHQPIPQARCVRDNMFSCRGRVCCDEVDQSAALDLDGCPPESQEKGLQHASSAEAAAVSIHMYIYWACQTVCWLHAEESGDG